MYLGWPQFIYLVLSLIGIGIAIQEHRKPKTGNNNIWATLIGFVIVISLLFWGGFFNQPTIP